MELLVNVEDAQVVLEALPNKIFLVNEIVLLLIDVLIVASGS